MNKAGFGHIEKLNSERVLLWCTTRPPWLQWSSVHCTPCSLYQTLSMRVSKDWLAKNGIVSLGRWRLLCKQDDAAGLNAAKFKFGLNTDNNFLLFCLLKRNVLSAHSWEKVSLLCSFCNSCGIAFTQTCPQKEWDFSVRPESNVLLLPQARLKPCSICPPQTHSNASKHTESNGMWTWGFTVLGAWLLNLTKLRQHLKGLNPGEFVWVSWTLQLI